MKQNRFTAGFLAIIFLFFLPLSDASSQSRVTLIPANSNTASSVVVVRAASTANVTIASGLVNGTAFSGITLATGDKILLKDQTLPIENGIYIVPASGAATRFSGLSPAVSADGRQVFVQSGASAGLTFMQTASPAVVGTNSLVWQVLGQGVLAEYGENIAITDAQTIGTTLADVTGSSFTIPSAGRWKVQYIITGNTATTQFNAFALYNSSNALVPSSQAAQGTVNTDKSNFIGFAYITTAGAETFKLRGQSSGAFTVSNIPATFSSSTGTSKISWEKISGNPPVTGQTVDTLEIYNSLAISSAAVGNKVFDTVRSGNIPYNTATGAISLIANKTYEFTSNLVLISSTNNGNLSFGIVDIGTNVPVQVNASWQSPLQVANVQERTSHTFQYTPTANQTVVLRCTSGLPNLSISAGVGTNIVVKQLGSSAITTSTTPQVIATNATAFSVPNSGVATVITGWSVARDTTGSFNGATGVFTAPKTGCYQVNSNILLNGTWNTSNFIRVGVNVNNVNRYNSVNAAQAPGIFLFGVSGSFLVNLNQGDTLNVVASNNRTAGATPLSGSAAENLMSITYMPPTF
jgi:hypothetical protein